MKQKVVRLEISKLVAIVIAVVVVAFAAGFFVQSSYFQGLVTEDAAKILDVEKSHKNLIQKDIGKMRALLNRPTMERKAFDDSLEKLVFKWENAGVPQDQLSDIVLFTRLMLDKGKARELSTHLLKYSRDLKSKPIHVANTELLDATKLEAAKDAMMLDDAAKDAMLESFR